MIIKLFLYLPIQILILFLLACTEDEKITNPQIACSKERLKSLCPLNSTANLDVDATALCKNLLRYHGDLSSTSAVDQICADQDECKVVCDLDETCPYGIQMVVNQRIVCHEQSVQTACGDGICSPPETVNTCPIDCNGNLVCMIGTSRCYGDLLQSCNLQSRWDEPIACPSGYLCNAQNQAQASCVLDSTMTGGTQDASQDAFISDLDMSDQTDETCIINELDQMVALSRQAPCRDRCPPLEMIPILAGQMTRGSTRQLNEQPVKTLQVSRNFYISKAEITVSNYQACIDAGSCTMPIDYQNNRRCTWYKPNAQNQPINCITWKQARDFARWIGGDLPTETQWEYVAKGGACENRTYPWGEREPSCLLANYHQFNVPIDQQCNPDVLDVCSLSEGNTKDGVCDMLGNVSEFVLDEYADTYAGMPLNESPRCVDAPRCERDVHRVVRGGSLFDEIQTTTFRISNEINHLSENIGFRVVKPW